MLFAARIALVFAVIASTGIAARADDLSGLFTRMRERSGPVWRAHLTSLSHVTFSNSDVVDVRSESQGVRFSTYECRSELCGGTYFDGSRLFSININGTTLPEEETVTAFLRAERTIASLAFLDPAFNGTVEDRGYDTIDDVRYRAFLVATPDATPMIVYVDPKRAVIRYMIDVNEDETLEYRDYRAVDGYYLPFLVLRNGSVLERYDERGSTSEAFAAPHGLKPQFRGAPAPVATDPNVSVPIFPCKLAGVTTRCLLDSGNSGLSMSLELSEQLQAAPVGSFVVRGLGNYATQVVRAGQLEVGNAVFPSANYVVLHDIHRFGYDVVLGADIFASTTIGLDPVHHRITFDAPVPQDATTVPLVFQNFVPVLTVQLGSLGTQLALDTGDESNINLAYGFYKDHPGLFSATEQRPVQGVGGASVELIGKIPHVTIGNLSVGTQTIGTTQTLNGTAFGHLGAGFLSHFDVVIDYAAQSVHFVPTPAPSP